VGVDGACVEPPEGAVGVEGADVAPPAPGVVGVPVVGASGPDTAPTELGPPWLGVAGTLPLLPPMSGPVVAPALGVVGGELIFTPPPLT
jgi:hypothetical protein